MWNRRVGIGALVAVLGLCVTMVTIASATAEEWVVDPLRYVDVEFNQGFRSPDSIHLVGEDGQIYYVPARLWGAEYAGPDLAEILGRERSATVRVSGGANRWLHGYPTVVTLETETLSLQSGPRSRGWVLFTAALGPVLLLVGIGLSARGIQRS